MVKFQPKVYASMRDRLNANSSPMWLHARDPEKPWTQHPCRIWKGSLDGGGYAKLGIKSRHRHQTGKLKGRRKNKSLRAHRVSLAEHLGVPVWMMNKVSHSCDTKPCIEPEHLNSWTQKKNMQDMIAKGRGKNQFISKRSVA